jgi:hypothetical protein
LTKPFGTLINNVFSRFQQSSGVSSCLLSKKTDDSVAALLEISAFTLASYAITLLAKKRAGATCDLIIECFNVLLVFFFVVKTVKNIPHRI